MNEAIIFYQQETLQYIAMKVNHQESIFIDEGNSEKSQSKSVQNQIPPSVPYFGHGDSNIYVDQFLEKQEDLPKMQIDFTPIDREDSQQHNPQFDRQSELESHQLTINPSTFHNFQKHLTVALKHVISLPSFQKTQKDYVKAAIKLWKVFAQSKICTKKILHFLLGEHNQHQTTTQDLRQFGFAKTCESFGQKIILQARKYLLIETRRQLKQGLLESYFEHKKIKDMQKFKKYVAIFIQELQQGFLRKRLSREKVLELMA